MPSHHCSICKKDLSVKDFAQHWKIHKKETSCPVCGLKGQTIVTHIKESHSSCKEFTRDIITEEGDYLPSKNGSACGTITHDPLWEEGGMNYIHFCKKCYHKQQKKGQ